MDSIEFSVSDRDMMDLSVFAGDIHIISSPTPSGAHSNRGRGRAKGSAVPMSVRRTHPRKETRNRGPGGPSCLNEAIQKGEVGAMHTRHEEMEQFALHCRGVPRD
jgi:hypothetical protein